MLGLAWGRARFNSDGTRPAGSNQHALPQPTASRPYQWRRRANGGSEQTSD